MKMPTCSSILIPILVSTALLVSSFSFAQITEPCNELELRINRILGKMSMQEKIEQLYYKTDGNQRLGIPQFTGSDGPHGIGNKAQGYSSFPVTIAMAATWDRALITKVGRAIAREQAARGRDRIAGPTLDLLIDPRIGRAPETIGEDPFLGGSISEAFVLGQNTTSIFGTIKHYNLNTYEINRRTNNYLSDERSLVEFWGMHWKRTIQYAGAMSVMCAYNWVNGDKCAENKYLIKNLLRDHWGFNFYTMSDWGGFTSTEKALNAELDFCEGNDLYIKELPDGVVKGKFDTMLVNRAVRNVLRTKIMSGMMDGVPVIPKSVIDSKEHRELVYESGLKSLVLLKNENHILPLSVKETKSIALIGPNAAVLPLDGNSSSKVAPSYRITVQTALQNSLGSDRVHHVKGCNINDTDRSQFNAAIEAAKASAYVVFVGGLDSTVEGEGYFLDKEADEKGGGVLSRPDRPSKTVLLPGLQNELINAIAKVNPNIILVVISGGTCSVTPVLKNVKGLLYAFYPGQEGGRAIADVLFGKYNPSGKLPATIPKTDEQIIPISADFRNMVAKGVGYRWFDSQKLQPAFVFGSGMSYTDFRYANLIMHTQNAKVGDMIRLSFDLTNTGKYAGEEVAQLYLSTGKILPSIPMPEKQLRGFEKVLLQPGETKKISFTLTPEEFYIFHEKTNAYRVPSGEYLIQIGGSSDKLVLTKKIVLHNAPAKPDLLPVNIRSMPAFPKEGEELVLMASVINNGTAPIKKGDTVTVHFLIDGKEVASYHSTTMNIPVGGMQLACATGVNGKNWVASKGVYKVTAIIQTGKGKEISTINNSCTAALQLPNGKLIPQKIADIIQ